MAYQSAVPSELRSDFAAFADPGAAVEVIELHRGQITVNWQEDGKQRTCLMRINPSGAMEVQRANGAWIPYATFLAGPDMANLKSLARNTLQVIQATDHFMSSRLTGEDGVDSDALTTLEEHGTPSQEFTRVIFLSADAGVGKTSLLRQATRDRAEAYLSGRSSSLWLYVDAQARRLAALDEALASELDTLRARITFDAVVPLVKAGALTVVVDGFDELIGSVGAYDEAFRGLADFLGGLNGRGTIVAAARSAYYEEEFLERVNSGLGKGDRWLLEPLRLREWGTEQRVEYITSVLQDGDHTQAERELAVQTLESRFSSSLSAVAGKPFFVARMVELWTSGDFDETDTDAESLLSHLVRSYIIRESAKLLNARRQPILTVDAFQLLFEELALEMWQQESRELTRSSVSSIASTLGEIEQLDDDSISEVAVRAPYFAMLSRGSSNGSVSWEHDVYYAYFLSHPMARDVARLNAASSARLLRRGRLPQETALLVGSLASSIPAQDFVASMSAAVIADTTGSDQVRRNAGLLVAGRLKDGAHSNLVISGITISDVSLGASTFNDCIFDAVRFLGTDMSSVRLVSCESNGGCTFERIVIDPSTTRLDVVGIEPSQFFGLRIREGDAERLSYAPDEILDALRSTALPAAGSAQVQRDVAREDVEFLYSLARYMTRTNIIAEGPDSDRITSHAAWRRLRPALLESGVLRRFNRDSSGRKIFYERTVPAEEIIAGFDPSHVVSDSVRSLWDELAR